MRFPICRTFSLSWRKKHSPLPDLDVKNGILYEPNIVSYRVITYYCAAAFRSHRFRGGKQQDSHEMLRHLMDGIIEEHKQLKQQQVRVP